MIHEKYYVRCTSCENEITFIGEWLRQEELNPLNAKEIIKCQKQK